MLLSESVASTNEDDNDERCASMFSLSCEDDGPFTSLDDVLSENSTDLSDASGLDFGEDIQTVLQSIKMTSEEKTNKEDTQMDMDLESTHSELDSIPEALKSAYDMDTFCQFDAEGTACSAEGEEIRAPESDGPRNTSILFNEREKNRESPSVEDMAVVRQSPDSPISVTKDEDGISSTMLTTALSNDCFHEAAVSCQSESCLTEVQQTKNNIEKVNNNGQNVSVAVQKEETEHEEEKCHAKGKETSKLDLACLEKRRYPGVIDPTPREFLGKTGVPAKAKEWPSACLAIFQEERTVDDATLLAECEKHLNSSKQSNTSRFMSWWNSRKSSNRSSRHPTDSNPSPAPFGTENQTSKVHFPDSVIMYADNVCLCMQAVTEFSKQCQKWSRVADRKRSFFGFLMPSFR